jgi:hypothetical protein
MKDLIDPNNVFGINNTIVRSEEEAKKVFEHPIRPAPEK